MEALSSASSSAPAVTLSDLQKRFPNADHNFLVIFETFQDQTAADAYVKKIQDGWVLNTSLTTHLAHGQYAAVRGPFATKEQAENVTRVSFYGLETPENMYVKDAGKFLWPSGYPFDATLYPAGILQALASEVDIETLRASTITFTTRHETGCRRQPSYSFFLYGKTGEALRGEPVPSQHGDAYAPFKGTWLLEEGGELQRPITCLWD